MIMAFRAYVCERIRTLDLLVRSQTLYPAELHTLNVVRRDPIRVANWEDALLHREAPSDEVGF